MRKCINSVQLNVIGNELLQPGNEESSSQDWQIHAIDLFKRGNISEARKLIIEQINLDEYEEFFKLCYRNPDWFGDTEDQQEQAIMYIREGLVKHTIIADPEINLSATLCQLARIRKDAA